jgi:hypothetical protein
MIASRYPATEFTRVEAFDLAVTNNGRDVVALVSRCSPLCSLTMWKFLDFFHEVTDRGYLRHVTAREASSRLRRYRADEPVAEIDQPAKPR